MTSIRGLDPREKPPESIRSIYKHYERLTVKAIDTDANIIDFVRGISDAQQSKISRIGTVTGYTLLDSRLRFSNQKVSNVQPTDDVPVPVYEYEGLLGLHLIPCLLSQETQRDLLSRLMHGILADEKNKNNVQLHFRVPYHATRNEKHNGQLLQQTSPNSHSSSDTSFFNISPKSTELLMPLNPNVHKPITISQFLNRKLRWLTLGRQYDWTAKAYPIEESPAFPQDIAALIGSLFPAMRPEAAILNVYTPGDTLSVHRDVSEDSEKGLVSISIGCDALFVVGIGDEETDELSHLTIRLRSGDAIYMSGPSRFAWHGVPKIIPDSCPQWLRHWPAHWSFESSEDGLHSEYEAWRGWMSTKRVNLNVRQMND